MDFQRLWETVMICLTSEAICKTVGSMMSQHGQNGSLNIILIYSWVWLSPLSYFRFEVSALPLVFASPILTPPHADQSYRARDTAIFDNAQV